MKVLFYGDLQVSHASPEYVARLQATLNFLIQVIEQIKPDVVVNLGDTYDTNGLIDVLDLLDVHELCGRVARAMPAHGQHIILLGNHDIGAAGRSAIELLLGEPQTHIVMQPIVLEVLQDVHVPCAPYTRDFDAVRRMFKHAGQLSPACPFAIGHVEWIGAKLNPASVTKDGMDVGEYSEAFRGNPPTLFNGHYHNPLNFHPVYFVGSPLYKDFADAQVEIPRGFALYETSTRTIQQIRNPHTYLVETIRLDSEADLGKLDNLSRLQQGDTKVRVYAPKALLTKIEAYRGKFLWLGSIPTDEETVSVQHKVDVSVATGAKDIVAAAVQASPPGYDRGLLQTIGEKLFA